MYAPPEIYLSYGKSATLNCHFRANPPLLSLRWEKDGFLYDPRNVPGVYSHLNGSLFFSKIDENHSGLYSCTPRNALGTEGASSLMKVVVQHPPEFTIRPERLYFSKLGSSVTLHCDARNLQGKSRPDLLWSKKDLSMLPFDRIEFKGGNMTIRDIIDTDHGIYKCTATNEAASISLESELVIQSIPSNPPYNISANSSDTQMTLKWEKGLKNTCTSNCYE